MIINENAMDEPSIKRANQMTATKTKHLEDALISVIEKLRQASSEQERRMIQIDLMMLLAETYAYESRPLPPEATSGSDDTSIFASEESLESELSPDSEAGDLTPKLEPVEITHESVELRFDSSLPLDRFSEEQKRTKQQFVDEDDVIEKQMARLLHRVRRVDDGEDNRRNGADVIDSINSSNGLTSENGSHFVVKDQSYSAAKPKHEQNKTAVEEQMRLFRSVAKDATRNGLKEHARKEWKNIVLFTSGLTIVSALSGLLFYGLLFGSRHTSFWCGSACFVLFIISAIRLIRALTQLNQFFDGKDDSHRESSVKYLFLLHTLKRLHGGSMGRRIFFVLQAGFDFIRQFGKWAWKLRGQEV
jgi:hypothetical protein